MFMKKTFITIAATVLLFGGTTAFAATNSASVEQLIAQLQTQIASLTTQLAALKAAQSTVATSQLSIGDTLKLIGDLKEGMTGDQVTLLQTALAADPLIYPEGKITGYYGKLTSQAIKRLQKKQGLEVTGKVGSTTAAQINKILGDTHATREGDDKNGRICVPKGHTIASGWLKHAREQGEKGHGNGNRELSDEDMLIPLCGNQNGSTTPNTVDTAAPLLTQLSATPTSSTTATVSWATNEAASSKVYFGTTSPLATGVALNVFDGMLVTTHQMNLSGLSTSTTYYTVVLSRDAANNIATSSEVTFVTPAL